MRQLPALRLKNITSPAASRPLRTISSFRVFPASLANDGDDQVTCSLRAAEGCGRCQHRASHRSDASNESLLGAFGPTGRQRSCRAASYRGFLRSPARKSFYCQLRGVFPMVRHRMRDQGWKPSAFQILGVRAFFWSAAQSRSSLPSLRAFLRLAVKGSILATRAFLELECVSSMLLTLLPEEVSACSMLSSISTRGVPLTSSGSAILFQVLAWSQCPQRAQPSGSQF